MSSWQRELIEWAGVDHELVPKDTLRSPAFVNHLDGFVVYDGSYNQALDVGVYVWRYGYRHPPRGVPCIDLEGPDALWPVVLLDDHEILQRDAARAELGLRDDQTVGFVPSTRLLAQRVPEHAVELDCFPALRWFRAFDALAIAPGWTHAECHAAGVAIIDCGDDLGAGDSQRLRMRAELPPFTPNAGRVAAARVMELAGQ